MTTYKYPTFIIRNFEKSNKNFKSQIKSQKITQKLNSS